MKMKKPLQLCHRILVVEDDEDLRELVVDTLRNEGFTVEGAANGAEALRTLADSPDPTLIFLDLMMPSMNGWEFLDAQRKDPRLSQHKVVTISALKSSASLEDSTPLKTDGAINKPLSLDRIWSAVREYCEIPVPAAS